WLDARAAAAWDSTAGPLLTVTVEEGRRQRLETLALDTPGPQDSARFAQALELPLGGWVSPVRIGEAVERAVREAADQGHPYATLGVSAMRWDSSGAHVRLSGALGPQVTITRVRLDGLRATRQGFAERAMGRLAGTPFSQARAVAARDRLARLGLFRAVEFRGIESEGDVQSGELVYAVEEPRYNRFEGAVGIQSGGRAVGLASLGLDNLAGTGRALALRWESRGKGAADFGARYAEPLLFRIPLAAEAALEQQDQDTLYNRTRWGGRLRYTLTERDRIAAGFTQERVVQSAGEVQFAAIQTTDFSLERDTRDQAIAPRRGRFAQVTGAQVFKRETLRPTALGGGRRSVRAAAVESRIEWHRPLGRARGLALELSGAGRFSSQRVLPLYERYPVGGAASLRGQDEQAFRVDRFGLSRLEWRWFLGGGGAGGAGGQRVFLFWDHALMGTRVALPAGGDRMETLQRDGIGFGLRLDAAGGTVGVDYGLEPGRAPLDGKIHLRLVSTF
ncbi:MAG TPA: BamA/TamA family outer membrane protein, partial [Candidatus Eisenbacteria bacterium]|nr:BamA/TamA family outer membrane protein [Candidatus Eisenbacteria bacterium]